MSKTKVGFTTGKVEAHKLPNNHVALILPPESAQWLADINARIGGSDKTTRRRHSTEISDALRKAGFDWKDHNVNGRSSYSIDMDETRRSTGFTFIDYEYKNG